MYEDQPGFTVYETLMQTHFAGHPLGMSILGSKTSIGNLASEQMRRYHSEHYKAGNITLAVAGNVDWETVLGLAKTHCSRWPAGKHVRPTDEARPKGGTKVLSKDGSVQEHVMQMAPAPPATHPLRFAAELLSVIVGDDSGSRLYWELTDPGEAETAELGYNEYDGSGTWMTYLSCTPDNTRQNLERIHQIYDDVNKNGVTGAELEQARNKVASRIVLRSERPMGRLSSLGGNWVYRKEYRSVKDDLDAIKSLTAADIRTLLDAYPLARITTAAVGPLESLN
jgi:predicted Zn-dependent peptidase